MNDKKKYRKQSNKHGSSCKCPDCCFSRSKSKQERKLERNKKLRKNFIYKGKPEYSPKSAEPGFLSGGHQYLKKIDIEDISAETGLYVRCTTSISSISKLFNECSFDEDWPPKKYFLFRIYKIILDHSKFTELGKNPEYSDIKFLWHGTKTDRISSIGHHGMFLGSHGLLGGGIYTSPDFAKAWGYSGSTNYGFYGLIQSAQYKPILLCAVRLGKVWNTNNADRKHKINASSCKDQGCNSSYAGSGNHTIAYGGRLNYSEFCCYDDKQVLPLYVLLFKEKEK